MAEFRSCNYCPKRINSIFRDLCQDHLSRMTEAKTTNKYRRGQTLFYEGNPPSGLFCVSTGKIKVFKSGNEGKEAVLRIAGTGDTLGLRGVISGEEYPATAQVLEDAVICFFDKRFFNYLIREDNDLALKVIREIAQQQGRAENRLTDLTSKTVRQRLCHLLLTLQRTHGKEDSEGTLIDVRLSRAELASMIGATPETVIRLLSDFKDLGYVHLRGKKVIVADSQELLREADIEI